MKFPYQQYPIDPSPLFPAGVIDQPEVPLAIIGPSGVGWYSALLDTGANHCVLPASEAATLGIDLDGADQVSAAGFTGDELVLSLATVELQISDDVQTARWSALVGFAPFARPEDEAVILGHTGCLDYFRATFDGDAREIDLVPIPRFPGTVS